MSPKLIPRKMSEDAKYIARDFHESYEELAPSFGYRTRDDSAVPWDEVPEQNRKLMIATVQALLDLRLIRPPEPPPGILPNRGADEEVAPEGSSSEDFNREIRAPNEFNYDEFSYGGTDVDPD